MALADTNAVDLFHSSETVYGEVPASPAMTQLRFTGEDIAFNKQTVASEQIRSDRAISDIALVGFDVTGSFNFELAANSFDTLFSNVMSSNVVAVSITTQIIDVDSSAKTFTRTAGDFVADGVVVGMWIKTAGHTNAGNNGVFLVSAVTTTVITASTATGLVTETGSGDESVTANMFRNGTLQKSLLLEKRFTDITQFQTFTGMRVGSMALDVTSESVITGSFGFLGKTSVTAVATVSGGDTGAATTEVMTASANVGTILRNGVALATPLLSVTLNVDTGLRKQPQVGSTDAAGVGYGFFALTGTIEAYFEDSVLYDDLIAHTSSSLSFRTTDNAGNVIIFTIPKLQFTEGAPNASGGNADVTLPLGFSAVLDATSSTTLQIDSL